MEKSQGETGTFCTAHVHPLNSSNIFALHSSKLLFTHHNTMSYITNSHLKFYQFV